MQIPSTTALLGAAWGIGAQIQGTKDGPIVLQNSLISRNKSFLAMINEQNLSGTTTSKIQYLTQELAQLAQNLADNNHFFVTVGGDHSCAIGTWSGVQAAIKQQGELGLIWIDAHMDSHTPQTSPSKAIHGMPVAALLGHGSPELVNLIYPGAKIKAENICLIGIRSYEPEEQNLLKMLNVRVYHMDEVKQRGLLQVFAEAVAMVTRNTLSFGVSIDLDGIDPVQAPGVGSPAANGLDRIELCSALRTIAADPKFIAAEIAEFNPHRDHHALTEQCIIDLIASMRV